MTCGNTDEAVIKDNIIVDFYQHEDEQLLRFIASFDSFLLQNLWRRNYFVQKGNAQVLKNLCILTSIYRHGSAFCS